MESMSAIILAAGQGKRMKSKIPKVLHRAGGRPLIRFPLELAAQVGCSPVVVVVGHGQEHVRREIDALGEAGSVRFAVQAEQRGTGDAVRTALAELKDRSGSALILSGDVPLLDKGSVERLKEAHAGKAISLLTFRPLDPTGYGRIVRKGEVVAAIREHKDCTQDELLIEEVNAGIYLIDLDFLAQTITSLGTDNAQGELYLTDLVERAALAGRPAATVEVEPERVLGVNDRVDLARVDAILRSTINLELMRGGVTIRQPGTVEVELDCEVGQDTELHPGVRISGTSRVGRGCIIETGSLIRDSVIEDGAVIRAYSVIEDAHVGSGAEVGPVARLRPGARLLENVKVGNFVEVKNTRMGRGSKANHLAYLGDGEIGEGVNVGAGTIFCNYDGYGKHKTVLEDGVFIGSDSQLVAPVRVGRGAYVGSGSTITHDVPPDALAVGRGRQVNKEGKAAVLRQRLEQDKKNRQAKKPEEPQK